MQIRAFLAAFLLALALVGTAPRDAVALPTCSGTSGLCSWEVAQEPDGTFVFWLTCASGSQFQFIDEITACELCCRLA